MYTRRYSCCGCYLDPGERYDCSKEKAALEAGTFESGKGQKPTNTVSHQRRNVK